MIEELGNPFLDKSEDLLALDTRNIMEQSIKETEEKEKVEAVGEEQYSRYVKGRLLDCTIPITGTITKNKLPLFSRLPAKSPSRRQLQSLNNDCHLFLRLFISYQIRDGDLDQFLAQENQPSPP